MSYVLAIVTKGDDTLSVDGSVNIENGNICVRHGERISREDQKFGFKIVDPTDYENTKRKFRPENVIDLTNWKTPAVKKLDSFFKGPKKGDVFGYSITNEKGDILYTANS